MKFNLLWRWALGLLAVLMLMPMVARADMVYYKEADGTVSSCDAQQFNALSSTTLSGDYYISDTTTIKAPITVADTARIILMDGGQLWALGCIVVEEDHRLTITTGNTTSNIAGSGILYAIDTYNGDGSGNNDNAGDDARIGSREGKRCGYITINDGYIYTYSTYSGVYSIYGADIGSGYEGYGGIITINGGNVSCTAGYHNDVNSMCAATIGSGYKATHQLWEYVWITINGGKVDVRGTDNKTNWGAGIGTGQYAGNPPVINITGGTVESYCSYNGEGQGAGIGTGDGFNNNPNSPKINISGGTVTAYCSGNQSNQKAYGAGIGMGDDFRKTEIGHPEVTINITGGMVKGVSGYWRGYGSGIGGGEDGGAGTITISGSADVIAYNCHPSNEPKASGIGDGEAAKSGWLKIYCDRCVVDTWGLYGMGDENNNFNVQVTPSENHRAKVESGSSYWSNASGSPQYLSSEQLLTNGSTKWRRISNDTSNEISVYYSDEGGNVAGPVTAINCTDSVPTKLGGDVKDYTYYYYLSKSFEKLDSSAVNNHVILILADSVEAKLNKGICVKDSTTLTITAGGTSPHFTSTGILTAQSTNKAGIGSYFGKPGEITINDVTVNAFGGDNGAGIGAGNGSGSNISINRATINATGGNYGAGIGGGYGGDGGTIIIDDATITAIGSTMSAGIGGGNKGDGGTITINGGTITATGSIRGAGIGGGNTGTGGIITINRGTITAKTGSYAPGIGGGFKCASGIININGGTVDATGGTYASGIGGGFKGNGCNITISGGSVKASGGTSGASIGAGKDGTSGTLAISDSADVIMYYNESNGFLMNCDTATATPPADKFVYVQDANGKDIQGTPSGSQLDLSTIDLSGNYAHIFFAEKSQGHNLGDVNHDGTVDLQDVTALIAHLLGNVGGGTYFCEKCADVNSDGIVDLQDVTALVAHLLGN